MSTCILYHTPATQEHGNTGTHNTSPGVKDGESINWIMDGLKHEVQSWCLH